MVTASLMLAAFNDDLLPADHRLDFFDPTAMSAEDWRAFHGDMWVVPVELPSDAEVKAIARSLGLTEPPF